MSDVPATAAGQLIVGHPWHNGRMAPDDERPLIHVFANREDTGLAVARCGLRQEDRSYGWVFYDPTNAYQAGQVRSGAWVTCDGCLPRGGPKTDAEKRSALASRARQRALQRVADLHPDEYVVLLFEERVKEGLPGERRETRSPRRKV